MLHMCGRPDWDGASQTITDCGRRRVRNRREPQLPAAFLWLFKLRQDSVVFYSTEVVQRALGDVDRLGLFYLPAERNKENVERPGALTGGRQDRMLTPAALTHVFSEKYGIVI